MARYISVRLGWALVMVIGIVAVGFVITHILPGDPVDALVGDFPAPPDYVAQVRTEFGLDRPLYIQLWLYLVNLAHGNLGFSFLNRQPVLPLILQRAGTTLLLMIPALILASVLGILIAVRAAAHAGRLLDSLLTGVSLAGYSIPVFWLAQVLIVVFAVNLGWLPAQGIRSVRSQATGLGALLEFLKHWALPGFCITIFYLAVIARVARSSMLEMLHQDFVLTARAKGLSERTILWRHVLRNALIPVITVIGYNFGYSLTGAILTETVFAWPGLGGLFITSISNRDYPVLAAIFLLAAVAVVAANLITDLLYAVVDPRVRLARTVSA
jgi:ABC-type dipeptide/oligopeptide/nickel transport system permease component